MSTAWIKLNEAATHWQDETGERIAWPSIVQYTDGENVTDAPDLLPHGASGGYWTIVHDLDVMELLVQTQMLYDGQHRGGWPQFRDARSAPGA